MTQFGQSIYFVDPHQLEVIFTRSIKLFLILKGSSNISSDPPITLDLFYFYSLFLLARAEVILVHSAIIKVFLPRLTSLDVVGPDPDEPRWVRPKQLDLSMTASPSGESSSFPLLPTETKVLTYTTLLKCSSSFRVLVAGVKTVGQLVDLCILCHVCACACVKVRDTEGGGLRRKKGALLALTAPEPPHAEAPFQNTNRNQTHGA